MLFVILTAPPGTAKSDIAEAAFRPFRERQQQLHDTYIKERKEYQTNLLNWKLNKAEMVSLGIEKPEEPRLEKLYIDKLTSASLSLALPNSRRSITIFKDEVAEFIRGLKGETRDDFLSFWNNSVYSRETAQTMQFVEMPFVNMVGTIQPERLSVFAKGDGMESGFSARFLFGYQEARRSRSKDTIGTVSEEAVIGYEDTISRLMGLELHLDGSGNPLPTVIGLDREAFSFYERWRAEFTDYTEDMDNMEMSIRGKLENYSLRFALILQLLYWASSEQDKGAIGLEAVKGAIRLTEYFLASSLRAHRQMAEGGRSLGNASKVAEVIDLFNDGRTYPQIASTARIAQRDIKPILYTHRHQLTPKALGRLRDLNR